MKTPAVRRKIFGLLALLVFSVLLGILKGSVAIPLSELFLEANRPILTLRILRILLCVVTGSGLAVSGIALQAVLRNPLAEPYLLGTSSGAGLGASLALVTGFSSVFSPMAAFLGAVVSVILVYFIARQGNKVPAQSLILAGVIVSITFSGILVFLVSTSSSRALHGLMWWLWGSLEVYDLKLLFVMSGVAGLGVVAIYLLSQDLNAMSLGEEEAVHLGIDTETIKKILFLLTSLVTACLVCVCGVIGFVGLIIPHITRFLIGPNHKVLIPCASIAAASFMILCDVLSRTLFPPSEIPIGVVTALIGAPTFVVLLKRKQEVK